MIRLRGVEKRYPGTAEPAVKALDLDVPTGEIVMLVGPSGCGKTTTLKMINRLTKPTAGTIEVDGRGHRRAAAPRASPRHRVRHPADRPVPAPDHRPEHRHRPSPAGLGRRPRPVTRVDELMDTMGLDHEMADRYPSELSGGQRQRAGVTRALAADPPVLLMDEPFGAVDPLVRTRLQRELLRLQDELHKTIVFVTHDIDEAIHLGDRVAILNVGGVLEQYATPEEILATPANDFVADFLGNERGLKRLALIPVTDVDLGTWSRRGRLPTRPRRHAGSWRSTTPTGWACWTASGCAAGCGGTSCATTAPWATTRSATSASGSRAAPRCAGPRRRGQHAQPGRRGLRRGRGTRGCCSSTRSATS